MVLSRPSRLMQLQTYSAHITNTLLTLLKMPVWEIFPAQKIILSQRVGKISLLTLQYSLGYPLDKEISKSIAAALLLQ